MCPNSLLYFDSVFVLCLNSTRQLCCCMLTVNYGAQRVGICALTVYCSSCASFCISCPMPSDVSPQVWHLHLAVHVHSTCMTLTFFFVLFAPLFCISLSGMHKTSGIASSIVNVSSLIQVHCTVLLFIFMVQPLYIISNQCTITVFKFTVNCG